MNFIQRSRTGALVDLTHRRSHSPASINWRLSPAPISSRSVFNGGRDSMAQLRYRWDHLDLTDFRLARGVDSLGATVFFTGSSDFREREATEVFEGSAAFAAAFDFSRTAFDVADWTASLTDNGFFFAAESGTEAAAFFAGRFTDFVCLGVAGALPIKAAAFRLDVFGLGWDGFEGTKSNSIPNIAARLSDSRTCDESPVRTRSRFSLAAAWLISSRGSQLRSVKSNSGERSNRAPTP